MKRILTIVTGKWSIVSLLLTLLVLEGLLIVSTFYSPTRNFLAQHNIFEVVVVACLLQILLLLSTRVLLETPVAITLDHAAQQKIRELIDDDKSITSVKVVSAGVGSRANLLRHLLEHPRELSIGIVACFSEANPDPLDRDNYGPNSFSLITHRLDEKRSSRLEIRQSHCTPSVRCILLASSAGPRYAFLGWYTYQERNQTIQGRENVQIQVDRSTPFGIEMLNFADQIFKKYSDNKESDVIWPPPLDSNP